MKDILIKIKVEVNPTESLEKVRKSIENVFGFLPYKIESKKLSDFIIYESKGWQGLLKFSESSL